MTILRMRVNPGCPEALTGGGADMHDWARWLPQARIRSRGLGGFWAHKMLVRIFIFLVFSDNVKLYA